MNNRKTAAGTLLVALGCLLLMLRYLFNIEIMHFESGDFWPIIVLGLGLTFEFIYFGTGKNSAFLVPGGVLTVTGILFFFEVATDWRFSEYTWPIYILAAAAGLFQLYLFGGRHRGLLIPVGILTLVAVISFICMAFELFFSSIDIGFIVPAVLICGGLYFIFCRKRTSGY